MSDIISIHPRDVGTYRAAGFTVTDPQDQIHELMKPQPYVIPGTPIKVGVA